MDKLADGQPGVTAWSKVGSRQVLIDGQEVPAMGLRRELGSVEPGDRRPPDRRAG